MVDPIIIDPTKEKFWDNFLLSSDKNYFFNSSYWAKVLKESYGYQPCYVVVPHPRTDTYHAALPCMEVRSRLTGRRGVSLPFTDFCLPTTASTDALSHTVNFLIKIGRERKWRYIELRCGRKLLNASSYHSLFYIHELSLESPTSSIFRRLKSSTQRNIRKSARSGLTVEISNELCALKDFYSLHTITRKRHGAPPQPFIFFRKINQHIMQTDHGTVITARLKGQAIASAVFFHFGQGVIYKFGASDLRFQHTRANNMVIWTAIEYFAKKGYSELHFGRTSPDNTGLLRFKRAWAPREERLEYFRYNLRRNAFTEAPATPFGRSSTLMRNLPIPVLKIIGKLLYPHIA